MDQALRDQISNPSVLSPCPFSHLTRRGPWLALLLQELQLAGARAMSVADLINGGKPVLMPGTVLASAAP